MGNVVYLPTADRLCRDCGGQKAVAHAAERMDPLPGLLPTRRCPHCGDRVEDLTPCLTLQQAAGVSGCHECGTESDDLIACTFEGPAGSEVSHAFLCEDCLAAHDERVDPR
ncbi:hypothetical protein [Thermomonas sp.]|uniref:hypothetical protein n=1 Tax=Thermomonas sp. TaxID=1971895 RepID=UPI001D327297|nr:hypothetical protein [Thermomonas sp.]MBZ0087323.1 hypothetical protein [Thermomonas sp.]HRO63834.1 hypothetical protein [Thermomonas sp.]